LEFQLISEGERNTAFSKSFPDYSKAKTAFETAVYELMNYCSSSDLWLYMQQDAPPYTLSA
jgi:hypothetical protein